MIQISPLSRRNWRIILSLIPLQQAKLALLFRLMRVLSVKSVGVRHPMDFVFKKKCCIVGEFKCIRISRKLAGTKATQVVFSYRRSCVMMLL
jgi:hypothetical protein